MNTTCAHFSCDGIDIRNFFQWYKPGEMWLHLLLETPREAALAAGAGLLGRLTELLVPLAPVYKFALWGEANNHVLKPGGTPS